jgi:YVTN family beta-propeller protein
MTVKRLSHWPLLVLLLIGLSFAAKSSEFLSPGPMALDTKNGVLYTALTAAHKVAVSSTGNKFSTRYIEIGVNPNSVLLSRDRSKLFVSAGSADGELIVISLPDEKIIHKVAMQHTPMGIVENGDGRKLYVTNRFSNSVAVINCLKWKVLKYIAVVREPKVAVMIPASGKLLVLNFLPLSKSTDVDVAVDLSVIDTQQDRVSKSIRLTPGAHSAEGLAVSTDSKFAYITHVLSRYGLPVTQLERGWVNSNALSVVDLISESLLCTVLLDDVEQGAANPKEIVVEGSKLYIALSGLHSLMVIDEKSMLQRIDSVKNGYKVNNYVNSLNDLNTSLSFISNCKSRIPLTLVSPSYLVCGEGKIYISGKFTPSAECLSSSKSHMINLGAEDSMESSRRGELAFNDASICYQGWQSCSSCHPDGRSDGLNWDQLNDGIGNPKNTKSLLFSHQTPPSMITGIRENAKIAVRKGMSFMLGTSLKEQVAVDIDNYLKGMTPIPSPYLVNGKLSTSAKRGEKLFEKSQCSLCHSGKHFTDGKSYIVHSKTDDSPNTPYDTPTLREVWRTAPYLLDGRATTIQQVLREHNADNRHGDTQGLSIAEIDNLTEYILSL